MVPSLPRAGSLFAWCLHKGRVRRMVPLGKASLDREMQVTLPEHLAVVLERLGVKLRLPFRSRVV